MILGKISINQTDAYFNFSMFFDACDGIFLNYCWNSEKLLNSKTSSMSKERPLDVYVGIDVFGRGCLGDGGYNTIEVCFELGLGLWCLMPL